MIGSRFNNQPVLTIERLQDFVALDHVTAQTPLIEVSRNGPIKIWVAYDLTRTIGTFTEVWSSGLVKTVTVYPSGKRYEKLNRPAYRNLKRVSEDKKPYTKIQDTKRTKTVHARTKNASAKK